MAATTWRTDPTHTDVQFSTKHMMVTTVRGKFTSVDGTVLLDEDDPTASSATFTVDVASLHTGADQRDGHLRSPDFFDTATFPQATFTSTSIEPRGGNDYRVTGDLTIRDTTRPITFDVEFLGLYQGMNGARRAGFHATARLDREAWGLTWNVALESGGWLVGKEIRLEIDVALEQAVPAASQPDGARAIA